MLLVQLMMGVVFYSSCTDGMGNWDGCGGNYKSNYDRTSVWSGWTLN